MKSTLLVLRDAKAKIEQGWCQRALARDASGDWVHARGPEAVQWCALGALQAVTNSLLQEEIPAWKLLTSLTPGHSISLYNNTHSKEEVLSLFDKAIATLEPRNFAAELMEKIKTAPELAEVA